MTIQRRALIQAAALAGPAALLSGCGGGGSDENAGLVRVNGKRLYQVSLGSGTAVVFMHGGLGLDHEGFRPYLDDLSSTARVVYYDHYGNGRSDRPADYGDITFASLSADCDALTRALGIDKFVLVGHSYGGFIALDFALRFPNRLSGLVLTCTAATLASFVLRSPLGGTTDQQAALGRVFGGDAANATDAAFRTNWTGAVPLYYNNATPAPSIDLADIDRRTRYSAPGFNRGNAIFAGGFDLTARLASINVPTLVLYGQGDIWRFGDPANEQIARNIPGATLKYYQSSGHWPFQEQTSSYLQDLRAFVAARGP